MLHKWPRLYSYVPEPGIIMLVECTLTLKGTATMVENVYICLEV